MYKTLVTGASGFIGRYLTNRLIEQGADISIFVRNRKKIDKRWAKNVKVYRGDITDKKSLLVVSKDIEVIFHLAAAYIHKTPKSEEEKKYVYKVNVDGTKNILETFVPSLKHFIFFSSISVYDGVDNSDELDENSKVKPNNTYGESKLISERLIAEYGKKHGFITTSLRLPFVYGPGNKGNIFKMIEAIDKRRFILMGRGDNRRSAVYVGNVVDSALLVVGNEIATGKNYIVTDGINYTVKELYTAIAESLGRKIIPFYMPLWLAKTFAKMGDSIEKFSKSPFLFNSEVLRKLTASRCFSSKKIQEEIGFIPKHNFYSTINETVNWYKKTRLYSFGVIKPLYF